MPSRYLVCRHCIYCEDKLQFAMCKLHNKRIDPGVPCCKDVVYNQKGLLRLGKKQRKKIEDAYKSKNQGIKSKTKMKAPKKKVGK